MAKTPTMTPGKSKKSKVAVTDDAKPDKTSKKVDNKGEKKPAKKLDKVSKAKSSPDHPPFADMVKRALENLKSRQGCSLSAIRNFISTQYNLEMNKRRQNLIKSYLSDEFQEGRLVMTNGGKSNGGIDYSKRFSVIDPKKKSEN